MFKGTPRTSREHLPYEHIAVEHRNVCAQDRKDNLPDLIKRIRSHPEWTEPVETSGRKTLDVSEVIPKLIKFRSEHPKASWNETFNSVPNPFADESGLRRALERYKNNE